MNVILVFHGFTVLLSLKEPQPMTVAVHPMYNCGPLGRQMGRISFVNGTGSLRVSNAISLYRVRALKPLCLTTRLTRRSMCEISVFVLIL